MDERSWIARLLDFRRDGDVFLAPKAARRAGQQAVRRTDRRAVAGGGGRHRRAREAAAVAAPLLRARRRVRRRRRPAGRAHPRRPLVRHPSGDRRPARQDHPRDDRVLPPPGARRRLAPGGRRPPSSSTTSVPKDTGLEFADRFEIRTRADDDSVFAVPPFWIRTKDVVEDDPLIHACTLTFMSDFGPVPVARPPGALDGPRRRLRGQPRPRRVVSPAVPARAVAPLRGAAAELQRRPRPGGRVAVRRCRRVGGEHQPGGVVAVLSGPA